MTGAPLDPAGKVALLRAALEGWGLRTLVETGLYLGHGSGMGCLDLLDRYVVFDCQPENVELAHLELEGRRLDGWPGRFEVHLGDSGLELERWLAVTGAVTESDGAASGGQARPVGTAPVTAPCLFWLDAHALETAEGCPPFPTLRELSAIARWHHGPASVVLVDDLRMFDHDSWPASVGAPGLDGLLSHVVRLDLWRVKTYDDVLRLTPRGGMPKFPT